MEQPLRLKLRETVESTPGERLESATDKIEAHLNELSESGSDIDSSEQTVERVTKKVSKIRSILNAASIGMALMTAYEVGSYATSRYEITAEAGPDGKTKYKHEDPQTTRIMQFLTGEKELAVEDRIYFYQQVVRDANKQLADIYNEDRGIDAQAAFEKNLPSDEKGLRILLRDIYTKYDVWREGIFGNVEGDIETRIDEAFAKSIERPTEYDPALEKMIWDLQMKVGAPRIRWSAPEANIHSKVMGHIAGPGRANYERSSNTVYITPGSDTDTLGKLLVSEDAHALQFNKYPVQSRARYVVDMAQTALRAVQEHKSMHSAQYEEYKTPGTIEYEAHNVIEPRLIKEAVATEAGKKPSGE